MTSAGLTASSSASSLTVIVPGSSIAPRSRGSATWTCAVVERAVATRRLARARDGRGCRSYSWPRAPPSMVVSVVSARQRAHRAGSAGSGVLSARPRAPLSMALVDAVAGRGTRTRRDRRAGRSSIGDHAPSGVRTIRRRSRFGRTVRQATQDRLGTPARRRRLRRRAYDATSSVGLGGLLRARFGLAGACFGAWRGASAAVFVRAWLAGASASARRPSPRPRPSW